MDGRSDLLFPLESCADRNVGRAHCVSRTHQSVSGGAGVWTPDHPSLIPGPFLLLPDVLFALCLLKRSPRPTLHPPAPPPFLYAYPCHFPTPLSEGLFLC